ncbi:MULTISPECIES: nucleoid-associated protein [Acinetobacter]|uniref:nucleoid-associated protein n=1 Tax=Acinetobacter TaxID=469 RepID=UPI000E5826D1|nr:MULTISPECIES: nucleoid-associated protein [Acinetobacter]MBU3086426.1 nucleoid-associated protein [Acinetobacter seifertii]QDJ90871.1 nucleoid-associated protein [Acinetobacter haemolyticus]
MTNKYIIKAMIIHRLNKEQHQTKENRTAPLIREHLHSDDVQGIKLIDFLENLSGTSGIAHSHSSSFTETTTASLLLDKFLFKSETLNAEIDEREGIESDETEEQTRYRRLTVKLTKALDHHTYEDSSTTGEHLPIIFFQQDGINYLYMALIRLQDTITIEESTGNVVDTSMIDAKDLKVAFKINLDAMKEHAGATNNNYTPQNYVSWVQKGTTAPIPRFIQNYIPIKYMLDDRKSTTKLIRTFKNYLNNSDFNEKDIEEMYDEVLSLLRNKVDSKQLLNISEEIDPIVENRAKACNITIHDETTKTDKSFKKYREDNGYNVENDDSSNIFSPSHDSLTNFEKFTVNIGSDNSIRISGYRDQIGHTIHLDDTTDPNTPKITVDLNPDDVTKVKRNFNK